MRVLKSFSGRLRDDPGAWLLLHEAGEYEYRNPDSVYVHRWNSFATEAAALDYLDRHVTKADRPGWRLYRAEQPQGKP